MKNKLILVSILCMFLLTLVSVNAESAFTFQQHKESNVSISCYDNNNLYCSSSTECNITIFKPDGSNLINNKAMTHQGSFYNYTLDHKQTKVLGEYLVNVLCDGIENAFTTFNYEVTPSGSKDISEGQALIVALSIISIIVVSVFFLFISSKLENFPAKIILGSWSAIMLLVTVLYSMAILGQVIGGYSGIIEGYATFFLIIKITTVIGSLALIFYVGHEVMTMWKIRRGLIDR